MEKDPHAKDPESTQSPCGEAPGISQGAPIGSTGASPGIPPAGTGGVGATPHSHPAGSAGSGTGSSQASQIADEVKGTAEQLRAKTGEAVQQAQHTAKAMLSEQKSAAADALGGLAQALRRTAESLQEHHEETVAYYTDAAAEQVERFSARLRDTDLNELVSGAEDYARRQPELFLGGAVALGFVLGRFLKSSGRRYYRHELKDYASGSPARYGAYSGSSASGIPGRRT